jgi:hypothetical protein
MVKRGKEASSGGKTSGEGLRIGFGGFERCNGVIIKIIALRTRQEKEERGQLEEER